MNTLQTVPCAVHVAPRVLCLRCCSLSLSSQLRPLLHRRRRGGVISGWLLAFTLSLDDLVIASFTSGPSATTLPIKIFSAVRLGVSPEINALSTIMIAIVTVGVISASLVSKRSSLRAQKDAQAAERTSE